MIVLRESSWRAVVVFESGLDGRALWGGGIENDDGLTLVAWENAYLHLSVLWSCDMKDRLVM